MKKIFLGLLLTSIFLFSSCDLLFNIADSIRKSVTACPIEVKAKAHLYANMYTKADTEYVKGGQDFIRSVRVDCSGMVINCYKYAVNGTQYDLPFNDTTANGIYRNYSVKTIMPVKGDLVFMGDRNNDRVTHIGIFDHFDENSNRVYYIDSTSGSERGNAVQLRNSSIDSNFIVAYGVMNVVY